MSAKVKTEIRDRIKDFRRVKASELRAHPLNWRTHPANQRDALSGLLSEIGFAGAVLARETPDGLELIDGHLRRDMTGDMEIPVLVTDLDEREAALLLATYDPIAALAEADKSNLDALLKSVQVEDESLKRLLDDVARDAGVKTTETKDAEPKIDRAAELQREWQTEAGQVWRIGEHRLMCGDATKREDVERLLDGAKPDAIITDPPYAFGLSSTAELNTKSGGWHDMMNNAEWFCNRYCEWNALLADGPIWMFSNWRTLPIVMRAAFDSKVAIDSVMVWYKDWIGPGGQKGLRPTWELIALSCVGDYAIPTRGVEDFINVGWSSHKPHGHQAEKPEALYQHLISVSGVSFIYDPFAGSGTAMAACQNTNGQCRSMESSPAYVAVCLQRMKDAFGIVGEIIAQP